MLDDSMRVVVFCYRYRNVAMFGSYACNKRGRLMNRHTVDAIRVELRTLLIVADAKAVAVRALRALQMR